MHKYNIFLFLKWTYHVQMKKSQFCNLRNLSDFVFFIVTHLCGDNVYCKMMYAMQCCDLLPLTVRTLQKQKLHTIGTYKHNGHALCQQWGGFWYNVYTMETLCSFMQTCKSEHDYAIVILMLSFILPYTFLLFCSLDEMINKNAI